MQKYVNACRQTKFDTPLCCIARLYFPIIIVFFFLFVSVFLFPIFLTHFRCEYCLLILSISFVWFLCFLQLLSRHLLLLVCCSLVSFRKSFCFPLELCFSLFASAAPLGNLCQMCLSQSTFCSATKEDVLRRFPEGTCQYCHHDAFYHQAAPEPSFVSWRSCWFDFPFLLHCDFI